LKQNCERKIEEINAHC